jgi:hypothetical protein
VQQISRSSHGGGYLGGSLQWWWSKRRHESPDDLNAPRFGLGRGDFPYGPARISRAAEGEITTKAAIPEMDAEQIKGAALTLAKLQDPEVYTAPALQEHLSGQEVMWLLHDRVANKFRTIMCRACHTD